MQIDADHAECSQRVKDSKCRSEACSIDNEKRALGNIVVGIPGGEAGKNGR
jgi:hypothetical protein